MAAPVVSGIAAMVMVKYPYMNSIAVTSHVKGTSADVVGADFLRVNAMRSLMIAPVAQQNYVQQ